MFELVFLGTSAAAPSVHRGLPAIAVLAGEHRYLVDCGEGTQRQILKSGIGFKRLNDILMTHAHLDHLLGLGGLISTFATWEDIKEVRIWGSRHTLKRVGALLFGVVLDYDNLNIDLELIEIPEESVLVNYKDYSVSAFPTTHRGQGNLAYTFQQRDHRPFLVDKATALGVPNGPERRQLVEGQAITLADGQVIQPNDVLGELEPGLKLVVTGDIGRTDNILDDVRGADVLVTESTFLQGEDDIADGFGHLTARQAAEFAIAAGVGTLILTHLSRRYRERDILQEARAIFP
ncbi:MAG: MBL fold metallo-hydrolase, partial [Phototrophicaceae bacterium]